jgi:hypothetical protein
MTTEMRRTPARSASPEEAGIASIGQDHGPPASKSGTSTTGRSVITTQSDTRQCEAVQKRPPGRRCHYSGRAPAI